MSRLLATLAVSPVFSFFAFAQMQNAPSAVAFVRDANGKVTEIVVLIGSNKEIRGGKVHLLPI